MLPEDKLKAIEELRQRYGVAGMADDGDQPRFEAEHHTVHRH